MPITRLARDRLSTGRGASYGLLIVKLPVQRPETEPANAPSSSRPDMFTMNGSMLVPIDGARIQPEMPPSLVRCSLAEGPSAFPLTKVTGVLECVWHSPPTVVP